MRTVTSRDSGRTSTRSDSASPHTRRNAAASPGDDALARKARYLTRRRTMTHDIHHTVTGFGTDLPGEVGISAVYLAQIHQPVSLLYLCAVLLHTMPEPELYGRALHRLQEGLQMGWRCGNLLAQKWELGWERPLAKKSKRKF